MSSKTWRYSIKREGWDWYDRISGERGFLSKKTLMEEEISWGDLSTVPDEIVEKMSKNENTKEPVELEDKVLIRIQKIMKSIE
jgi:hypothetical protein